MNLEDKKMAVIGLGYVGLPLAVEFGKKRPVIGFDIKPARIEELRAGRDRTLEVDAEELAAARHLMFSAQEEDLRQCGIFIVTVPTPIDNAKRPDLTALIKASEKIGRVMPPGAVVIYESTVYPGATEEVCVPILERESGAKFNRNTKVVDTVRALQSFNADVHVIDPWIDPSDAMDEYGLSASSHPPASGQYDAIVLAVAHRQFLEWGAERIRAFGKPQHVLYDVKAVLPRSASDGRL